MNMQFSSANHPTHREDPEINMEMLAPGETGTFTPTTKGSHPFHDHINAQYTSTLVVE
jgi:S-adenosylmethionine:diacylglycerol 3-amino-3-carboxypropyl transferase